MQSWSAHDWGYLIGAIIFYPLVYGGILWLGHATSKRLTSRRDDRVVVRWPFRVAFGFVLLLLIGQCSAPKTAKSEPVDPARNGSP